MRTSNSISRKLFVTALIGISSCMTLAVANAATTNNDAADYAKAGAHATTGSPIALAYSAAGILEAQMHKPKSMQIPNSLLAGAHCIGVFPTVFKEGFIVAGKHGDGIVSCRDASGDWDSSAPVFFDISGGSIGFQAGAKITRVLMLFMSADAQQHLEDGNFNIGVNVTGTAGPVGAHAGIHTAPAEVIAYQLNSNGLFAGAQIKGTKFFPDESVNEGVYGSNTSIKDLWTGQQQVPAALQIFNQTLTDFAPSSKYNADMAINATTTK